MNDHENLPLPSEPDDSELHAADADPDADAPRIEVTMDDALNVLMRGDITEEHGTIRWSSNHTYLLTLALEGLALMAVYKPRRGERPLWDFPDGTLALRERAAFITSEALGWQIVPPTVLREGPRGLGSMQLFIDHDPNYTYFEFDPALRPQLARLAVFDVLVNNADRKGGHCLADSQNHVWGIDQGLTFNAAHKLRTVIWDFAGEPVPEPLLEDVRRLCDMLSEPANPYTMELCQLLNSDEMAAFERRVHRLIKSEVYPRPGPGPNYPWPPV